MANRALTANETTLIRSNQYIDDVRLFVTPKTYVMGGTITAVPTKYPYTTLTMSWNGAITDIRVGQMVEIRSGSTIVAYTVVRQLPVSNTLYIAETQIGAHGYANNVQVPITVGMTVTIYNHHPLWALNSRIANKTFYKYWDIPYSFENETEYPVANTGAWQAARLLNGETTHRFTLPKGGINRTWALDFVDGTVNNFATWTLPTGVTLVDGYSLDDDVIEVDAVAGAHLVELSVYINEEHIAYCWLFVDDGAYSISSFYPWSIDSDTQSLSGYGRVMKLSVYGTVSELQNLLFRGAGILLKEWSKYGGEELESGVNNDTFIGYIADVQSTHDGNIGKLTITVESPMVYAARIGQPSQSLTQKVSPSKWTEAVSYFMNPRGFAFYLIKWTCPALLDMHDLDIPDDYEVYLRRYMEVNSKSLQANLQTIADYLTGVISSASDGTTVMRRNPLYMTNAERNAIATVTTFLEQDVKAPFEYFRRLYNPFSEVRSGAFASSGSETKPKAWYVGRRWLQGSSSTEMPNFVVTAAQGLSKAREIVGHYEAEQNAEIQEIGLNLLRNQDVIDPAYLLWYAFTVSSTFDPYASGFSGQRLLATEINREWEVDETGIKKRISIIGKVETFGQLGEELPVGNVKGLSQGGWSSGFPIFWTPNTSTGMFSSSQIASLVFALNEDGLFAVTNNYLVSSPQWTDLNAAVDGEMVSDFDFDYASAYFTSGRNINEALGMYVVTLDGDNGHLWYFPDILRSNIASLIQSVTLLDTTSTTNARVKSSETYPSLVLVVFKDGTGTRYIRSTDSGASFGSLSRVGDSITDIEDNDNAPIGIAVYGQNQFVTAPNSSAVYGVYRATTAAGSFTKMTASQDSANPHPMIAEDIVSNDYLYVSQSDTATYINDNSSDYFPNGAFVDPDPKVVFENDPGNFWTRVGVVDGALKFTATSPSSNNTNNGFRLWFYHSNLSGSCYDVSFDYKFSSPTNTKALRINSLNDGSPFDTVTGQGQWVHYRASVDYPNWDATVPITSPTGFAFGIHNGDTGACEILLDNITLYIGDGQKLWRVTDATGSPSWSNKTPVAGKAPTKPFDFAVDLVNSAVLNTVTGVGEDWYKSTSSGNSWSLVSSSPTVRCFYTVGDSIFAAGEDSVVFSADGGDDYYDLEGNLSNLWNDIGRIKKIQAL